MASLRNLKRDIDYLVNEVVTDGYLALYFRPKSSDAVVAIIQDAVTLRNDLYERANSPLEKKNKTLVHKHYAALRRDMFSGVDKLFVRLSEVGEKK